MKKILMIAVMLCMALGVYAQALEKEENQMIPVVIGNINYNKPKAKGGDELTKVASAIINDDLTEFSDVDMSHFIEEARMSVDRGVSHVRRFQMMNTDIQDGLDISATIGTMSTVRHEGEDKDKDGRIHKYSWYEGTITCNIHITNIEDGKEVDNLMFTAKGGSRGTHNRTDAMLYAIRNLRIHIARSLNNHYPLYGHILESARVNKKGNRQKEVYIDLGSKHRIGVGQLFQVNRVRTVAGRRASTRIADLEVREIMGEDLSNCHVESKQGALLEAIQAGWELEIVSYDNDYFMYGERMY